MKRSFSLCFMIMILFPCLALGEKASIGKIKTGRGDININRAGQEIPVNIGDKLYQNDVIRTGAASSVGIIFEDNTILTLGPKSELLIDEYVFAPQEGRLSMIVSMLKGKASYLSGIIGKQSQPLRRQ